MAGKPRHWKEKEGRFWARLSIPDKLRPLFGGRTQLTEPLGGVCRIADQNHAAAVARLQAQIKEAHQLLVPSVPGPAIVPAQRSFDRIRGVSVVGRILLPFPDFGQGTISPP